MSIDDITESSGHEWNYRLNKLYTFDTYDIKDLLTTMYNKYERLYSANIGSRSSTLTSSVASQSIAIEGHNSNKERFNFSLLDQRPKGSSIASLNWPSI